MPGTRSPSQKKKRDERVFPIPFRVIVPPEGMGMQLDEMFTWLDREVGRGTYSLNSDMQVGHVESDAMSFYIVGMADAVRFSDRFDFQLADLRS